MYTHKIICPVTHTLPTKTGNNGKSSMTWHSFTNDSWMPGTHTKIWAKCIFICILYIYMHTIKVNALCTDYHIYQPNNWEWGGRYTDWIVVDRFWVLEEQEGGLEFSNLVPKCGPKPCPQVLNFRLEPDAMVSCCRCNKTGRCGKAGNHCWNSLPGNFLNSSILVGSHCKLANHLTVPGSCCECIYHSITLIT